MAFIDRLTVDEGLTSSRTKLATEDSKKGRLAGTVPPLHSQGFTATHNEGYGRQQHL
jgi:hypothetical protein